MLDTAAALEDTPGLPPVHTEVRPEHPEQARPLARLPARLVGQAVAGPAGEHPPARGEVEDPGPPPARRAAVPAGHAPEPPAPAPRADGRRLQRYRVVLQVPLLAPRHGVAELDGPRVGPGPDLDADRGEDRRAVPPQPLPGRGVVGIGADEALADEVLHVEGAARLDERPRARL